MHLLVFGLTLEGRSIDPVMSITSVNVTPGSL
jgi:hypothetical protein